MWLVTDTSELRGVCVRLNGTETLRGVDLWLEASSPNAFSFFATQPTFDGSSPVEASECAFLRRGYGKCLCYEEFASGLMAQKRYEESTSGRDLISRAHASLPPAALSWHL